MCSKMRAILVFIISYAQLTSSIDLLPGQKLPHADVLDGILTKYINFSEYRNGSDPGSIPGSDPFGNSDLDVSILDITTFRRIIDLAKAQYEHKYRRYSYDKPKETLLKPNAPIVDTAMNIMRQSIYSTRYRLNETMQYRKRYADDISYQIAVLVGSIHQILIKMDTLYQQMTKLKWKTHFVWMLNIYEKLLAGNVDVSYMTRRIFELQRQWKSMLSDEDEERGDPPPTDESGRMKFPDPSSGPPAVG